MKTLWAPWRMEFIEQVDKETECIFCTRIERKNDREDLIVARGVSAFVILNKYPYNNGHLMIVPKRHVATLSDLTVEESAEMMELLGRFSKLMEEEFKAEGFNVGLNLGRAAGAGVEGHIHFHLVPRWSGDTNFMPVLGETKVLPESLENVCDRLQKAWEKS